MGKLFVGFASWGLAAVLLAGCLHAQKPVRFDGPAALALEVLARELSALGLEAANMDEPSGILKTRWENLNFLYGQADGQEATLFRRYVAVVHPRPADTQLTLRAEVRACPVGTELGDGKRLPPKCQALSGLIESHQQELETLGSELRQALARLRPSPEATGQKRIVVVVFELQAPEGMLPPASLVQLTEYLSAKLAETGRFSVTPAAKLKAAIAEKQRESFNQTVDSAFQIELGRAVAAQKMIKVQLIQAGARCQLVGTLYDLVRVASEGAVTVETACGLDALPTGLDKLSRALVDKVR